MTVHKSIIRNKAPRKLKIIIFSSLLVCISIIVALIFGEVLLRFVWSGNTTGADYKDITVQDNMVGYRFVPNSSKIVLGQMNDYKTTVNINSKGFRGRNHSIEKNSNVKRILLLGDSEAFGQGVEEEDMLDVVMEKLLNRDSNISYEVINLAYPGTGTLAQEQLFITNGLEYNPDIAIFLVTTNDLKENVVYVRARKKNKLLASINLKSVKTRGKVPFSAIRFTYLKAFVKWQLKPYFLTSPLLRKIMTIFYNPDNTDYLPHLIEQWYTEKWVNEGFSLMINSFNRINALTKKNNIELVIAVIPSHAQFNKNYAELLTAIIPGSVAEEFSKDPRKPQKMIKEFCRSNSIHYIEILNDFITLSQDPDMSLKYVHDGHLNKRGTLEISKILIRELQDLKKTQLITEKLESN